jgi:hypothetical protein
MPYPLRARPHLPHADTFLSSPWPQTDAGEANVEATRSPCKTPISSSFLTEAAALERHIPERFALVGDPVVTVEFHYMAGIDVLPYRIGYNHWSDYLHCR